MGVKAAFFDFDGTLRRGDSIVGYMAYALKKRRMRLTDIFAAAGAGILYALKLLPVEKLKTRCLRFEKRMDEETLDAFARGFVNDRLIPTLLPDGLSQWRRYKAEGALTVLASASTEEYMRPLADALGADALICTGIRDHRVQRNCRGREKADRIRAWAAHRRVPLKDCAAYGNSRGDLDMLALVGSPHVIDPGRRTRKAAGEKGYPVTSWKRK